MTKEELLKHLMSAIPADYDWKQDGHDSVEDALLWWWCMRRGEDLIELTPRELAEIHKRGIPAETIDSLLDSILVSLRVNTDSEDELLPWLDEFYLGEIAEFFEQGPKKL